MKEMPAGPAGPTPFRPGRLRRAVRAHPLVWDAGIIAPVLLCCLLALVVTRGHDFVPWVFAAALFTPLIWRRRRPALVFTVIATVALVQWLLNVRTGGDFALLVALYAVAAFDTRRRAMLAGAVMEIGIVLASVRWGHPPGHGVITAIFLLSGLATAALALGLNVGGRRAQLAYLEERAVRLERERDQQTQLATAAERARIAREMHDVVAHNLSVMIALADGAAFALDAHPDRAAGAIGAISGTGRAALAEMRRLLGVLRDGNGAAERAPQPGIGDLDGLIEQVRAAGLPVTLVLRGDQRPLPAGAELAVFRVVQEGLTNTLKHGGAAATAEVSLAYDTTGVDVEIVDTGTAGVAPGDGGQGLVGMRERAAVYGGTVAAGPRPDRAGWRVGVRLEADPVGVSAELTGAGA